MIRTTVLRILLSVTLISMISSWPVPRRVQAADGDLDPTFGMGGKVITDLFSGPDEAMAVVIQSDGKIVVAGGPSSTSGFFDDFLLVRYNPDGSLDDSFGAGGIVLTDFGGDADFVRAIAIQADGKIVAAGATGNLNAPHDFALARYNPDGSLDISFDGDGKVITPISVTGGNEEALAVAIQPNDGKIIAAGKTSVGQDDFALVRYNPDGSLDTSFDGDGKVTTALGDISTSPDQVNALAIQSDGKIVAVGISSNTVTSRDFGLARYNPDGSLDTSFDGDGKVTTDFSTDFCIDCITTDEAYDVAIQPADGKIVAIGFGSGNTFALARYNLDGSLDTSFDGDGKVKIDLSNAGIGSQGFGIGIQPADGKLIAAGIATMRRDIPGSFTIDRDFVVARFNPDGSLDASFGQNGRVYTDLLGEEGARDVALQPDGKIVAVGRTQTLDSINESAIALVRYEGAPGAPSFDLCIQDESNGNLLQINTATREYLFTNCAGLSVGGTASFTARGCTLTIQDNQPDRRVLIRFDTCLNRATASVRPLAQGTTLTITDRNTNDSSCACN
jgi:uncharacterized delta-60 repeat protein